MRKNKKTIQDLVLLIPLLISGLIGIGMVFLLQKRVTQSILFEDVLTKQATLFIAISGIVAMGLMAYLLFSAHKISLVKNSLNTSIGRATQKMHNFRRIIELLYRSKMWLPGLKEYIDDEFEGLTYFDVKDFYKGNSKLAIEFLQENHNFQDTENLYLEFKAILQTEPKQKRISENIEFPNSYEAPIVDKWIQHKIGSGLWYYFGYKYGNFKEALDMDAVFERYQDKIMNLALAIDKETFEENSFNEVFLSKLGEYVSKNILPQLYQDKKNKKSVLGKRYNWLYVIFLLLVIAGVLLPIAYLLFTLPILTLIISYAIVSSLLFYIATTFYSFLVREAKGL